MSRKRDSDGIDHSDGTALRLYTYLPKDNTALTDGLLSTALAPSGFEKYRGRTGKHSKADVLRVLDSWEPEWTRSKALSALTEPIPQDAGSDFAEFARGHRLYSFDLKDLVRAKLLAHLRRARKGGGTDPVDTVRKERPNWHRKRKHLLFQGVPHYFVETTGGRVPPEFVREEKKAAARIDIPSVYSEVRKAYGDMGYPVSGDHLSVSEQPTYTNGKPVPVSVLRHNVSGGNMQHDGTVRINPNYRAVMRHWKLKGSGRDFLRTIIGHELGHHIDRTVLSGRSAERRRLLREIRKSKFHTVYTDSYGPDTDRRKLDKELLAEYLSKRVSDRLAKSAEVKTAASKLRALLNAGKLRPEVVSMLRRAGMLQSRKQYLEGARKMLKNRLEKIFAHAGERGIPLTVRTGVPRVESSHAFRLPVDDVHKVIASVGPPIRPGAVNGVWGRPLDPLGAAHTINIPGAVGIAQSSTNPARIAVDTTKARLHDILTANHELDEYLGWWRHGGVSAWHNPMAVLADLRTHMPGVLRRERVLYERLCNQLGVRSPRWSDLKTGGLTGSVPSRRSELASEQIQSTLTDRDHASLLRLLSSVPATEEEIAVATGAVSGDLFRPMWDAARSYTARAADLAARRGMRKLERYLKSNPVAYYLPGKKRAIASPNYHHVLGNQAHNSPEVSRVSAKELMDFYMGR